MADSPPLTGRLTPPGISLPGWAQDHLALRLWDRREGPEKSLKTVPLTGSGGSFRLETPAIPEAHRAISIGWGEALDPLLAHLPWPTGSASPVLLNWDGAVTVIGYVEQLHLQEVGGLPLVILEVAGRAAPITYRRLPPLPLPALGDRHSLHTDHSQGDLPEQVYYLLADAESPLAAFAQDAAVSSLRIACVASLGEQEAGWHEIVNVPLILDALTLIGP